MGKMKDTNDFISDIMYYQRKNVIIEYFEQRIKEDYDKGLNTSLFLIEGEWLNENAILNVGYLIRVVELLNFAKLRKFSVEYFKENFGICKTEKEKNEANGILIFF